MQSEANNSNTHHRRRKSALQGIGPKDIHAYNPPRNNNPPDKTNTIGGGGVGTTKYV